MLQNVRWKSSLQALSAVIILAIFNLTLFIILSYFEFSYRLELLSNLDFFVCPHNNSINQGMPVLEKNYIFWHFFFWMVKKMDEVPL